MSPDQPADRSTGASRSHRRPPRKHVLPAWLRGWPTPARVALLALVALVALAGIATAADLAASIGRVHPGVWVGPVDVGGDSPEKAAAAISDAVAKGAALPVTVQAGGSSWDVTAESVALSVDATGLAQSAYQVGRGDFWPAVMERVRAIVGGVRVPLVLDCDAAAFDALVAAINGAVATPPVNAGVTVDGTEVALTDPVAGVGVHAEDARPLVLDAFITGERSVVLDLEPLEPSVDLEGARQAYEDAVAMVSAPLVLYFDQQQWEVSASEIGRWIDFRPAEGADQPSLEAYIVSEEVSATVLPMVAQVGRPARDATFQVSNGSVTIIPAEDGLQADAQDLALRLTTLLKGSDDRRAELTMHRVEAEVTTEEAQGMGIVERISTFTTGYAPDNKSRVNNIHILADALDGTLVPPGGTFSFNEAIGPRTAEKGYQEANAIVNGRLVPQLGGGICQVASTIFNTVFFSGLPVVERRNHSQYFSSYPTGRDASVSWGGPDFKFRNDTAKWVLVAASYTNSTVTISLYGTSPGYQVTYDTGPWTDLKDPIIREVPDPTLPSGSRVIQERGVSGRNVVVVRHVLLNGVEIRKDTFKSVYKPTEEVVRVGTAAASPSVTATP